MTSSRDFEVTPRRQDSEQQGILEEYELLWLRAKELEQPDPQSSEHSLGDGGPAVGLTAQCQ